MFKQVDDCIQQGNSLRINIIGNPQRQGYNVITYDDLRRNN